MGRPPTNKHNRLVTAAIEQFHHKGYANTSLADVAKSASISAGNVFYYFKTKSDLARAVVDEWCVLLTEYLKALETESDPWRRLEGFLDQARTMAEIYVSLGCPLAGLTRDLRQEGGRLKSDAARIYAVQFQWLEVQFRLAGLPPERSMEQSRFLMAGYHGSILLSYAQDDPSLIEGEVNLLRSWLFQIRANFALTS